MAWDSSTLAAPPSCGTGSVTLLTARSTPAPLPCPSPCLPGASSADPPLGARLASCSDVRSTGW
eukprot:scaffold1159_cov215-Pinguiococcus_pyrenoidosus.AAC.14